MPASDPSVPVVLSTSMTIVTMLVPFPSFATAVLEIAIFPFATSLVIPSPLITLVAAIVHRSLQVNGLTINNLPVNAVIRLWLNVNLLRL